MKKLSLVLSILIICVLIFSCAKDTQSEKNHEEINSPANTDSEENISHIKTDILDILPHNDYKGKEIRILNSSGGPNSQYWLHLDICAENETGDPLFDAIYARNKKVEEHFNVQIKEKQRAKIIIRI